MAPPTRPKFNGGISRSCDVHWCEYVSMLWVYVYLYVYVCVYVCIYIYIQQWDQQIMWCVLMWIYEYVVSVCRPTYMCVCNININTRPKFNGGISRSCHMYWCEYVNMFWGCMQTYIHTYTCVCVYVFVYICMYVYITWMHTCTHTWMYQHEIRTCLYINRWKTIEI